VAKKVPPTGWSKGDWTKWMLDNKVKLHRMRQLREAAESDGLLRKEGNTRNAVWYPA
jgi:hypothetical protein